MPEWGRRMTDIRRLAEANKALADTQDCERIRVRAFMATFHDTTTRERMNEIAAAVDCNCRRCARP